MDWVRARSDDQVEQRINEIVDAIARLYEENRYEDITFAMIAKEANFTRSNLYRYFQTKEDIFLELLKHDVMVWRKDMFEMFVNGKYSLDKVTVMFVDLTLKHKRMIKLLTILFTLLEPNSSLESLTAFKKKITEEIGTVVQFLSTALPFPSIGATDEFLSAALSLIINLYPMMDLTSKQNEAMTAIGMNTTPEYYKQRLVDAIDLLFQGFVK